MRSDANDVVRFFTTPLYVLIFEKLRWWWGGGWLVFGLKVCCLFFSYLFSRYDFFFFFEKGIIKIPKNEYKFKLHTYLFDIRNNNNNNNNNI